MQCCIYNCDHQWAFITFHLKHIHTHIHIRKKGNRQPEKTAAIEENFFFQRAFVKRSTNKCYARVRESKTARQSARVQKNKNEGHAMALLFAARLCPERLQQFRGYFERVSSASLKCVLRGHVQSSIALIAVRHYACALSLNSFSKMKHSRYIQCSAIISLHNVVHF